MVIAVLVVRELAWVGWVCGFMGWCFFCFGVWVSDIWGDGGSDRRQFWKV